MRRKELAGLKAGRCQGTPAEGTACTKRLGLWGLAGNRELVSTQAPSHCARVNQVCQFEADLSREFSFLGGWPVCM